MKRTRALSAPPPQKKGSTRVKDNDKKISYLMNSGSLPTRSQWVKIFFIVETFQSNIWEPFCLFCFIWDLIEIHKGIELKTKLIAMLRQIQVSSPIFMKILFNPFPNIANYRVFCLAHMSFYYFTFRVTGLPNLWQKNNLTFLGQLKIWKSQNFKNWPHITSNNTIFLLLNQFVLSK